jgi:hypothetical protein
MSQKSNPGTLVLTNASSVAEALKAASEIGEALPYLENVARIVRVMQEMQQVKSTANIRGYCS